MARAGARGLHLRALRASAPIARLEELRLAALELRIEPDLALGRHAELVSELRALIERHGLRERLHAQPKLALYRSGRRAEGLEAYRRARRLLVDELGLEPGPALQELGKAILRQDPALDLAPLPAAERSILVAPQDESRLDALLALAEPLARRPPRELILARLVAHHPAPCRPTPSRPWDACRCSKGSSGATSSASPRSSWSTSSLRARRSRTRASMERALSFFVVLEGSATVTVGGRLVSRLGPGDSLALSAWQFRPFVEEYPRVAWRLLENMAQRLGGAFA